MKIMIARILCLTMVMSCFAAVLTGCTRDVVTKTDVSEIESVIQVPDSVIVEVGEDDPFTISTDGEELVILIPNGSEIIMQVAAETTLKQFLKVVAAKEGYEIHVLDSAENEVTDTSLLILDGMFFTVVKDGESDPVIRYVISVVSKVVIEQTIQKQEEINKIVSDLQINAPTSSTSSKTPESTISQTSSQTVNPVTDPEELVLASIWLSRFTNNDAEGKVWQSVFKDIEKQHKITTNVVNLDGNSATDIVVKDVMAGKTSADVYEVSAYIARCIARKNALVDLNTSKTLVMSNFDNAGTESMKFGKKIYGVSIDANATKPMGVLYNKDLIKKYAPDYNVEKLFNDNQWTFDSFKSIAELCTQDTNGDTKPDIYGLTSNTNVIGMALTANAGGTATMENGKVVAAMCSDAGIAALEWMKTIYNSKTWKYYANIKDSVNFFADGNAAMFASWMSYYTTIVTKADFSIGFVLMPKGPDKSDYINGQYDSKYFIVPKTNVKRLDLVSNWLNGTAAASSRLINEELKNLARSGFDETSREIYKWSVLNSTPEFSSGVFSEAVSSQVDSSVTSRSVSPAKTMKSIATLAQKELDDFFAPLY